MHKLNHRRNIIEKQMNTNCTNNKQKLNVKKTDNYLFSLEHNWQKLLYTIILLVTDG